MKKSLSVLALLLSLLMVLSLGSFSAYAEDSVDDSGDVSVEASLDDSGDASVDASGEISAEDSTDVSAEESSVVSEDAESKDAASADASEESAEESKDESATESKGNSGKKFPWALVIFLGIVVAAVIAGFVCIKLDNKVGRWLKNFFRDYKSEIKKVTWPSREITIKSTIVVLVCLIVSGAVIGLLDFGLAKLIELFRDLVSK